MSAKNKKAAARNASPSPPPAPAAPSSAIVAPAETAPNEAPPPFAQRHPQIANAIFAALCLYVAMIWLLALDQTFHWGLFGPKIPLTP